ncbi:MAG: DUF951 domain-containing protein [Candidatus Dormiibacterota bacterium]
MSPEALAPVVGMRVRLRKPHACGADVFRVGALGADIRLFCEKCGTKVFIERPRFRARVKEVLDPASPGQPGDVS